MASVNKVFILGNLGRDPELRHTAGGNAVCNFSVATTETWNDKGSNQKQERTEWHRIVVWGKSAENCAKYLAKGRPVHIEGSIQTREWEDRDGNKKYTTEIVARQVTFLGSAEDGQGSSQGGGGQGSGKSGGRQQQQHSEPPPLGDDDIPF